MNLRKENLSQHFEDIKQFMILLFGKDRGIEDARYRPADITIGKKQYAFLLISGIRQKS